MYSEEDQSPATHSDNYDQARSCAEIVKRAAGSASMFSSPLTPEKQSRTRNNISLKVDEITRATHIEVDRSKLIAQRRK